MRHGLIYLLILVALQVFIADTGKGQSMDTAKVILSLKNESLASAIGKIERQSSFRFFFRDADVRPIAGLNLIQGTRTIRQTLEILLKNTSLSFRQMDGNILLEKKNQQDFYEIKGKVVNGDDKAPVTNASVFLSNTTIGNKTGKNGAFTLYNIKPGKYYLVVSLIGYETYRQTIQVDNGNITLPDIKLLQKTILLNEVSVHSKNIVNWERNYTLFKDEFLGKSNIAKECKILNPEILDIGYNETTSTLTASSTDFLLIENPVLGYRIKYLLTDFTFYNRQFEKYYLDYKGFVFFEEMEGTASQKKRWQKRRLQVYQGSMMHFLRSAACGTVEKNGFRVQQLTLVDPGRPSDSLVNARINFYRALKSMDSKQADSLSFWLEKARLPERYLKLMPFPLNEQDFIAATNHPGQYILTCNNDGLYIAYNKNHHFHIIDQLKYLDNPGNTENTLVNFNSPNAFFNSNGILSNPNSLMFYGAWSRKRVAELLPTDYEAPEIKDQDGDDFFLSINRGEHTTF